MRFGLKSAIVGAAAFAVLVASGGTSFALLSDFAGTPDEQKAAGKCYATIQKELAKYAATHAKLVVKCKASVIKGKGGLLGDCNPLSGDLGTKNSDAIAKLDSRDSAAQVKNVATDPRSATSSAWNSIAGLPGELSAASRSVSSRRPPMATRQPAACRPRAMPSPIPVPPPVTTAVLPERSMMCLFLWC